MAWERDRNKINIGPTLCSRTQEPRKFIGCTYPHLLKHLLVVFLCATTLKKSKQPIPKGQSETSGDTIVLLEACYLDSYLLLL